MQDSDDRREHRRLPYNREVKFAWLREGCIAWPAYKLLAEDISKGGVRLKGNINPEGATSGIIELKRADGTRAVMGVQVVYTKTPTPTPASHMLDEHNNHIAEPTGVAGARFFALTDDLIERELTDADGKVTGLDAYVAA